METAKTMFTTSSNEKVHTCLFYFNDAKYQNFVTNRVAFTVTAINLVVKIFIVRMINYIGFTTRSKQTRVTMVVIFFAHFLNYIAILVFADTAWFKSDPLGIHEMVFGAPP